MKTSETPAPATAGRSFRLLCSPEEMPRVEALLQAQGYRFEPEPFSPFCRRLLDEPRPLGASLAAFFGYIYIQDRSSMLPPLALDPAAGGSVLDICASPGSKTGFLAQLVGKNGFVLGNEPSRARLATLRANMHACNLLPVSTCTYEGQNLPLRPGSWEAIQLDPPCSGWGTVEKHPRVMELWQGEKVQPLVGLQRLLLRHAADLLAPGGKLVYSTCTTNVAENEEQVRFAEQELGLEPLPLTPFPGFVWEELPGGEGTLRVDGQRSGAQGFYVALFRKPVGALQSVPEPLPRAACRRVRPAGAARTPQNGNNPDRNCPARRWPGPAATLRCCRRAGSCSTGIRCASCRRMPPACCRRDMVWQGALLGKFAADACHPAPRLRALLPRRPDAGTAPRAGRSRRTDGPF